MRLYLLRHAKAEPASPTGRDFDRPLHAIGHAQTAGLNQYFAAGKLPLPTAVVSSPAVRALDTARRALNDLDGPEIVTDERIWNGAVSDLLDVLADHLHGPEPLMLVGHNPGFESLARWLTATVPAPGVKTATLVDLEFTGRPQPGCARLNALVRP